MAVRIDHDQSNADYHADGALGSTYLKDWDSRSPAHAEYGMTTINRYIADEGTAAHLVFEGKSDLVLEAGEKRVGALWVEKNAQAKALGGTALPTKAYKAAIAAGNSARNHPFMYELGYHAECVDSVEFWHETSVFTTHPATGLQIKCKPDLYFPDTGTVVDLKTAASASPADFTKSIFRMNYWLQGAFYRMVLREAGLKVDDNFHFIAVEKTPSYAAQHFAMEGDILSAAELRVEQILLEIAHSRETGAFSTGWPTVSKINLSTKEYNYGF